MGEDVGIADREFQSLRARDGVGQRLRLGCEAVHAGVGQGSQRRPELRLARRDAKLRAPISAWVTVTMAKASSSAPRLPSAVRAGMSAASADIGETPLPRRAGVRGSPQKRDPHPPRGAGDRAGLQRRMAQRQARHVVQGEAEVWRDLSELRIGDDGLGPGAILLGGLEEQHGAAALRALGRETARDAGEDRHMAVVAAEMRASRTRRAMGEGRDLLDRQGVEFCADEDRRAGLGAVIDEREPMAAETRDDPVRPGCRLEKAADLARRRLFLAGKFWRAVQRAPPVRERARDRHGSGASAGGIHLIGETANACSGGLRPEGERDAVHAVAQPGGRGPVVEDVAEMAAASAACTAVRCHERS